MFAKLLKYEWRSNTATFGILSLCALGVSLFGGILLRLCMEYGEESALWAGAGLITGVVFSVLALVGYCVAVEIILLVRFYKNKFTDEGYLTFTLPVSSHQIFLSSALNMLIWSLISLAVLVVSIVLLLVPSQLYQPVGGAVLLWAQLQDAFLGIEPFGEEMLLSILQWVISLVYSIVLMLTCLTIGSVIAKKHKILAAFGIYYGISMLMGIFQSILTAAVLISVGDVLQSGMESTDIGWQTTIITIVVQLVVTVAGYFTSTYLMKRELNLS